MASFLALGKDAEDLLLEISEEDVEIISDGIEVVKTKDIRVSFGMVDGERLFYCPYNRSHQVLDSKWNVHLGKCRRNGLKAVNWDEGRLRIQPCKYEPNIHHIPVRLMSKHLEWCRSRDHIEAITSAIRNAVVADATETTDDSIQPSADESSTAVSFDNSDSGIEIVKEGEEDWDKPNLEEVNVPDEPPKLNFVYRTPHGLTKSERKKFRKDVAAEVAAKGGLESLVETAKAGTSSPKPETSCKAFDYDDIEEASNYDSDGCDDSYTQGFSSDSEAGGDKSDLEW